MSTAPRRTFAKKATRYNLKAAAAAREKHAYIFVSSSDSSSTKLRKLTGAVAVWKGDPTIIYNTAFSITGTPENVKLAISRTRDEQGRTWSPSQIDQIISESISSFNYTDELAIRYGLTSRAFEYKQETDAVKAGYKPVTGSADRSAATSLDVIRDLLRLHFRLKYGGPIKYTQSQASSSKRQTMTLKDKYNNLEQGRWLDVTRWTGGAMSTGAKTSKNAPSEKSRSLYDPTLQIRIKSTNPDMYEAAIKEVGISISEDLKREIASYRARQAQGAATVTNASGRKTEMVPRPAQEATLEKSGQKSPPRGRAASRNASPVSARPTSGGAPTVRMQGATPPQTIPVKRTSVTPLSPSRRG